MGVQDGSEASVTDSLPLIALLDDAELDLQQSPAEMAQAMEDGLSESDGDLQGSDGDIVTALSALDAGSSSVDELEGMIAEVEAAAAAVTEDTLAAETLALGDNLAAGDDILGELGGTGF